ncbi:sugar transferase, partial [bacterium]|nr:sugar transferase [bacterium]
MGKLFFDYITALFASFVFALPFLIIIVLVKTTSKGPVFYWSKRIGKDGKFFMMPKFRSMRVDTPEVATDLLQNPDQYLTCVGSFLRTTSLDELPQLISVLKGEMSIVGPRPALHTQVDLIAARRAVGIDRLLPGITGWAQINGRDEIELSKKLELDYEYFQRHNIWLDIRIVYLTVLAV